MDQDFRADPMIEVFPRVTKCTFHKFGSSGSIQNYDALCILASNIINEKIYIFLWFWFIFLAVFSGVAVLYSMAIVLLPSTREKIIKKRFKFGTSSTVSTLIRKTQVRFLFSLIGDCNFNAFSKDANRMSLMAHDIERML